MNNYKITNLTSGARHYLNQEEKENFFTKNCYQSKSGLVRYDIINLTEQKRIKRNKILDNIQLICFFALTILITVYIIETYY
tara:strand:- start:1672 stop:1917 length:246 start_codon:yes stop_codon:yes gene_type:complete